MVTFSVAKTFKSWSAYLSGGFSRICSRGM